MSLNARVSVPSLVKQIGPLGPWYIEFEAAEFRRHFLADAGDLPVGDLLHACMTRATSRVGQLFLESKLGPETLPSQDSTYSFWLPVPSRWKMTRATDLVDWQSLGALVQEFVIEPLPNDFPPFVGGAAGLLSYDWCRALERIPAPARDDFQVPTLALGIYDHVIALHHETQRLYLIANGFPYLDRDEREQHATARLHELCQQLRQSKLPSHEAQRRGQRMSSHLELDQYHLLAPSDYDSRDTGLSDVWTATARDPYIHSIDRALEYLRAGDIFQVNLAQHLLVPLHNDPLDFYRRMRVANSAPYAAFFDLGNHQLVSASPERLVRVRGRAVQTRPIKGTRPRSGDVYQDQVHAQSLQNSTKDCCENVMIVDLLRNDLSRVCAIDSLQVTQLCGLEPYRHVQHLVSVIEGELEANRTPWDLVPALFPGGSITGAPKVRAMNIINELEPVARGAYCGSLGYIGFPDTNGLANADWNILIRTATLCGDWCQIPVGGGIVLDSQPTAEYEETLAKARGLLLAAQQSARAAT
jgi:para-aminobenzoate synthetase component I